jgi:hypothetical protein
MKFSRTTKGLTEFLGYVSDKNYQTEPASLYKKFYGRWPHKDAIARKMPFHLWLKHRGDEDVEFIQEYWPKPGHEADVQSRISRYLFMTLGATMERIDLELGKLVKELGKTQAEADIMAMELVKSFDKSETTIMRKIKALREARQTMNIEGSKAVKLSKDLIKSFNSLEWKATHKELERLHQTGKNLECHMRTGILDGLRALTNSVTFNFEEDDDDNKESNQEEANDS